MPRDPMQLRSVRVPEALWLAALEQADERNENLSEIIRKALEKYVRTK